MARVVYPGSFDPITLGHVDIIRRIQPIFSEITVLISHHSAKKTLFTAEERRKLAVNALQGIPGVKVDVHEGLTVDYMRDARASVIVRGLRAVSDFEYELVMANMNKKLAPGIETMIVFASPEFYYVASSTVKEVALHGGSLDGLVPRLVEKALAAKFADNVALENKARLNRKKRLEKPRRAIDPATPPRAISPVIPRRRRK
jgi:pantetheine-phosphate adenylyltransferase